MATKWIVPAVVLVLALSGCAPEAQTPDEAYLSTVREKLPYVADVPDEQLTVLGHQVCDMFDEKGFDRGMADFISYTDGTSLTADGAGAIAGSAVGAYCPEYSDNF